MEGLSASRKKTRRGSAGRGKCGGVRVTYFNRLNNGEIWLLPVYRKSVHENSSAQVLRQIKEKSKTRNRKTLSRDQITLQHCGQGASCGRRDVAQEGLLSR